MFWLAVALAASIGLGGGNLIGQQTSQAAPDAGTQRELGSLGAKLDQVVEMTRDIRNSLALVNERIGTMTAEMIRLDIRVTALESVSRNRFGDATKGGSVDASFLSLDERIRILEGRP